MYRIEDLTFQKLKRKPRPRERGVRADKEQD